MTLLKAAGDLDDSIETRPRAGGSLAGIMLVAISAIAYGAVPITAKLAFRTGLTLPVFLSWRFALAAVVLWAVVPFVGFGGISRRRILGLVVMGAVGYAGQAAAFFQALQRIPASSCALLLYTYPAIVTIGAAVIFKERVDARKAMAILIALGGTSLIVQGQPGGFAPAGVGFAFLSAVIYSAYVLFGSRLFAGTAPVTAAAVVMTSTAAAFATSAAVTGSLTVPTAGLQWEFVAFIAVAGTAVPVLAFLAGMPRVGPSRASIISTLEPAVTVVLAGTVLAEPLGPAQIAGAACILASVLVLESGRRSEPARI